MEDDNDRCYMVSPYSGLICLKCSKQVASNQKNGVHKAIYDHEFNNKNHNIKMSLDVRHDYEKYQIVKFKEIATQLFYANEFDTGAEGFQNILSKYLQPIKQCWVCTHKECINNGKIYTEKINHKAHYSFCNKPVDAFVPKGWNKGNPKAMTDPYNIILQSNFSSMFWSLLQSRMKDDQCNTATRTNIITQEQTQEQNDDTSDIRHIALFKLLDDKEKQLNSIACDNINIIDERSGNTWIRRVGWDAHLKDLSIPFLLKLAEPCNDNEPVLKSFITIFDTLVETSIKIYNEKTGPSGDVRFYMNRNKKYELATKPYADIKKKAWENYTNVMHTFIRILVRMVSAHQRQQQQQQQQGRLPKFFWDDESQQESKYFEFIQSIDQVTPSNDAIQKCLHVIISLFNQKIHSDPYNCIVLSILAVMGIEADGTFKTAAQTTKIFAAIFKTMKLLVYRQSYEENIVLNGTNEKSSRILDILERTMDSFMLCESKSPISWMYSTFNFAATISANEFSLPRISWMEGDTTVYYDDVRVNINDLQQKIIPKVIEKLTLMLHQLLLLDADSRWDSGPTLPDIIHDSPNNRTRNFSFLHHPANQDWITKGDLFVRNNMNSNYGHLWLNETNISTLAFRQYERVRVNFLKLMLFIIHITSGQPGRGTEVVGIIFANNNTIRNVFYDKESKMFYIWTRYHKGFNQTNLEKNICRFIPKIITHLLIRYLWLVLPFSRSVHGVHNDNNFPSNHLFTTSPSVSTMDKPDGVFESKDLTHILYETFTKYVNSNVTISSWRHIAIALCSKKLRIRAENIYTDDPEWDHQCAHSTAVADNVYANETALPQVTLTSFESFKHISQQWHKFLHVHDDINEHDNGSFHVKRLENLDGNIFNSHAKHAQNIRFDRLRRDFNDTDLLQRFLNNRDAEFRGKQRAVLHSIKKRSANILHVAGTGEGKSISFMLLGLYADGGISIIITPLVALKLDFLDRCSSSGISAKEWLPSTTIHDFVANVSLIFVTPESSISELFKSLAQQLKSMHLLDRIIFDECHLYLNCTEDFRDKMRHVKFYYNQQFNVQRIFLTATLPPIFEADLFRLMDVSDDKIDKFRSRTRRHNISYIVKKVHTIDGCIAIIQEEICTLNKHNEDDQKVIIFCRTISEVELISTKLICSKYYSTLENKDYWFQQWKCGKKTQIIAATSGLGAGIDIPNVYLVLMFGPPKSLCELVQSAGRSGRNGSSSKAIVLDFQREKYFKLDSQVADFLDTCQCRRRIIDQFMDQDVDRSSNCNSNKNNEELCDVCALDSRGSNDYDGQQCDAVALNSSDNDYGKILMDEFDRLPTFDEYILPSVNVEEKENIEPIQCFSPVEDDIQPIPLLQYTSESDFDECNRCEAYLEEFQNKCSLCVLLNTQSLSNCIFRCKCHLKKLNDTITKELRRQREAIHKFRIKTKFHACVYNGCYLPQVWCDSWELQSTNPSMYKHVEKACQCRNALLGAILGCINIQPECEPIYKNNKGDDLKFQCSAIIWGSVPTINLVRTFFFVYEKYKQTIANERQPKRQKKL